MVVRHLVFSLLAAAFPASPLLSADTALVTQPALTFFSSISEEPLARLEAESIGPRFVKHGPFLVPAPGVAVEAPTLTLHDQPCTAADWARVLHDLGKFKSAPGGIQLLVTLPDGRSFVFQRAPFVSSGMLSGLARPLNPEKGKTPEAVLLRIAHDGKDRLRADLRTLPSSGARHVPSLVVEPEPDQAEPAPSAPAVSESVASP